MKFFLVVSSFVIALLAFSGLANAIPHGTSNDAFNSKFVCDKMLNGNVNGQAKNSFDSVNGLQLDIADGKFAAIDLYFINREQGSVACVKRRRCPLIVSTNVAGFNPDESAVYREDDRFIRTSQRTINLTDEALSSSALRQLVLDKNSLQFRDRLFVKFGGTPVLFYDVVRQCHLATATD